MSEGPETQQTCSYSNPVLYMSLGRVCQLDQASCFYWHDPEKVKLCPALFKNEKQPEYRIEVLDSNDTFETRIRMFANLLKKRVESRMKIESHYHVIMNNDLIGRTTYYFLTYRTYVRTHVIMKRSLNCHCFFCEVS